MIEKLKLEDDTLPEIDVSGIAEKAEINLSEDLKPEPVAISIGTHIYKGTTYPTTFGSYGNFSCIVGASKSKKTFLKSLLNAAYIGGKAQYYAEDVKGHDTQDKYVIDLDTEQSKFHVQRAGKRVIEMVGYPYDLYKAFALREFAFNERLAFIDYLVYESDYRGKIGLMSIDGIADLVDDFNDLKQSTLVTQKLLEWTAKGNLHVITVLHKNFGTNKPTGHIGSSILKKAETVVMIENQGGNVKATPDYTRNYPFDEFTYGIDENWLPYIVKEGRSSLAAFEFPKPEKEPPIQPATTQQAFALDDIHNEENDNDLPF